MSKPRRKKRPPKRILALPDLEQSKAARPEHADVKKRAAQL